MLAIIALVLTIVAFPAYVFTMDTAVLRNTGVVLFGVAGVGVILGLISITKPGFWRRAAFALNLVIAGLFVYGFLFLTQLPETPVAQQAAHVPDFTLMDQNGKPVTLAKLRAKGPVHLVFYRGYW